MTPEQFTVEGLQEDVEIRVDSWGVPHIYATTTRDLYVAQGFNAARDRLWQLDYFRRRSLGLLAQAFGERLVPWDRAARRFIYRGDMRAEWLAYANTAKDIAEAFTAGINAYIDLIDAGAVDAPLEFRVLDYQPGRWDPEDIARMRAHTLAFNARQELQRALTLRDWGPEVEELRKVRQPDRPLEVPEGLDLDVLVPEILAEYDLGTLPVEFTGADLDALGINGLTNSADGSNNWVLGPSRTSTGRAIVANDPHRITTVLPSLRYIAHLSGPEFDVIGAGEPILPGISIGHNGKIAFGLTIFAIDQEDLFVHALEPGNPRRYRSGDDWVSFERVTEVIPVRGGEDVDVELEFSRQGPVIYRNDERGVAVSLGAAWLHAGAAPYLGSVEYMRANSIEDFLAAMNRWATPPENQIVADSEGRIAWRPGGLIPRRANWDGTMPVPGDGRYEWDGFYSNDVLPMRLEPESDYVATANQMLLDDDHPSDLHVSYDWYAPHRALRAAEAIEAHGRFSVREAFDLQNDDLSVAAREVIEGLAGYPEFSGHDLGRALIEWDFRMSTDSRAALVWERWWWKHFLPELFRERLRELGHEATTDEALRVLLPDFNPDRDHRGGLRELWRLRDTDEQLLRRLIASSLDGAAEDLDGDLAGKVWGDVHLAFAQHPLAELLMAAGVEESLVRTHQLPKSGAAETVGMGMYAADYRHMAGSTFRISVDVGNWDESLALNAPGQSGDLEGGATQALFRDWIAGTPFPLLYSRERVEAETARVIRLIARAGS